MGEWGGGACSGGTYREGVGSTFRGGRRRGGVYIHGMGSMYTQIDKG